MSARCDTGRASRLTTRPDGRSRPWACAGTIARVQTAKHRPMWGSTAASPECQTELEYPDHGPRLSFKTHSAILVDRTTSLVNRSG